MGQNETCKVTDFGMARDVLEENIYERKTKVMTADNEMNKSLIKGRKNEQQKKCNLSCNIAEEQVE